LNIFSNPASFAKRAALATLSRAGGCWWRTCVRTTALLLTAVLFANSVGQDGAAQARPRVLISNSKATGAIAGGVAVVALIGVGVYFVIQSAHTVKGCVTDDPDHLLLHTGDGKTYILLGATTHIKADTRIKVRGTRKKKINGITDQPSFVVEKLDKVYGSCAVAP
jgi:hypothetical protein